MPRTTPHSFTYNGTNSAAMGVYIEKAPNWPKPSRKRDVFSIPGRNGDLIFDEGVFESVNLDYQISYVGGPQKASEVADWLLSVPDYARFEDTHYPGVFRLARCDGPLDLENTLCKAGRAKLRMVARPEVFEESGEDWLEYTIENNQMETLIYNPWPYTAKPLIEIEGTGTIAISTETGGLEVEMFRGEPAVTIDCDLQLLVHDGFSYDIATTVYRSFPALRPYLNHLTITCTGGQLNRVAIKPRWWHL